MTGLSGDRLCAQRKNKIHNKQTNKMKQGTAGINKTNKMVKLSTKEKMLQDNSWKKTKTKQTHNLLIIWWFKQARPFETCPSITYKPQRCQIYIRNKHLTHSILTKLDLLMYCNWGQHDFIIQICSLSSVCVSCQSFQMSIIPLLLYDCSL